MPAARLSMISKLHMMETLVAASPAFAGEWEAFGREWAGEPDGLPLYLALADFARHVVALLEANDVDRLHRVFEAVEALHVGGDDYVREAATVGLLEDLQNTNLHRTTEPEQLRPFLRPESARCWDQLNSFWLAVGAVTEAASRRDSAAGKRRGRAPRRRRP